MVQATKHGLCVAPIAGFAMLFVALTIGSAQSQNPVEYDATGHLAPATLPHMYRYAFRVHNSLEALASEQEKTRGSGASVSGAIRYELGLSEADFAVFEDSAYRFGRSDKDLKRQIAAIRKADWVRHPRTWALSEAARTQVHALLAQGESDLTNEVALLKAGLSPKGAAALDAQIVHFYSKNLLVPAPGSQNKLSQPIRSVIPSPTVTLQAELALPDTCPTCTIPTVNAAITFSADGTTVYGNFEVTIPQSDADAGCTVSGVLSIDANTAPVQTDDVDSDGGATLDQTVQTSVSVGSSYSPGGSVQSCNGASGCSLPLLITGNGFQTGAPSITGISPSSAGLGTSGSITLSGTDLGGPPGNVPIVSVTSGTGLDLETTQPTTYNQSTNLSTGTQIVEYTVDPSASVGSDTFQLATVWGSTTGSFSVTCALPTIYNISPTPWTTGTKYNITITGDGFCTGSTLKITVPTGSVTITSPTVVNAQTMTATVQPTNTTAETATVTVTNSSGTSNGYPVTIQAANVGPLYLIDPYLVSGYSSGTLSTSTVLGTLPGNLDSAKGLIVDGTSTAIVALQVPSGTTTTFSVSTGSVAAYSTTFLTTAPVTSQTSITASPVANGSTYYGMALVQAPTSSTASSITVTAKTSSGTVTGTLTLYKPAVLLVHGLWGNQSALGNVQAALLKAGYSSNFVLPICYSTTVPWNQSGSGGTGNCQQTSVTSIGNALTNTTNGIYGQYDNNHIAGGRVDYVGHSMGGLAARYYSAQSTYLTNVRDRHQGAIHTFITIDTPAQGSQLANFLISNAACTVQSKAWYIKERFILYGAHCNTTMTVQQCFYAAGMPLAANGAALTTGAVYSLEPGYIQPLTYPGKPTNSTWVALYSSFPDTATPASLLRGVLQTLIANFYGTSNQPAGAPCNTSAAPPTLSTVLGTTANDVIVTTASQTAGFSQTPNAIVQEPGATCGSNPLCLEHTAAGSTFLQWLTGDSDANVLNSANVNTTVTQYLNTP
jgi:pimeloyl-ACP methyl ester carboxylesterase